MRSISSAACLVLFAAAHVFGEEIQCPGGSVGKIENPTQEILGPSAIETVGAVAAECLLAHELSD